MNNHLNELKNLQEVRASNSLRDRLHLMTQELPDLRPRAAFPLAAFRLAVASLVLLVLGSAGTGLLLAAKGSQEGSPLYPIKQAVNASHVPFFSSPTITPPPLPTVVQIHTPSVSPSPEEKKQNTEEDSNVQASPTLGTHHSINTSVKGEATSDGKNREVKGTSTFSLPDFIKHIPQDLHLDQHEESDN